MSAKLFAEKLKSASRGQFEVWNIDRLIELVDTADSVGFAAVISKQFLGVVARCLGLEPTARDVERWTGELIPALHAPAKAYDLSTLQMGLLGSLFRDQGKSIHACLASLANVRVAASWCHRTRVSVKKATHRLNSALDHMVSSIDSFLDSHHDALTDSDALFDLSARSVGATVAYPTACCQLMELLALKFLHHHQMGEVTSAQATAALLSTMIKANPGCLRPPSERHASSLPPVLSALVSSGYTETAQRLVHGWTVWVCDAWDADRPGLAGPYASPGEIAERILAADLEIGDHARRQSSQLAAALADCAYVFVPSIYDDVVNDIAAVRLTPSLIFPKDHPNAYIVGGRQTQAFINLEFPDTVGSGLLPHHTSLGHPRTPEKVAGPAAVLAITALCGDRLMPDCTPRLPGARSLK